MAFATGFLLFLFIAMIVIAVCTLIGIILFMVSIVMQVSQKKKSKSTNGVHKLSKKYWIPRGIGITFMIPLALSILFITWIFGATLMKTSTSLGYNVCNGNYARAELLLKWGVDPDCTLESNEPAKDGQKTLLTELCANGGFTDSFDDPADEVLTEEEKAMIRLLIEYGADLEAKSYRHEENNDTHHLIKDEDYCKQDCRCGYTPLLYAVYSVDETGGDYGIVEILLDAGADINVKSYCGYNVVHTVADSHQDTYGEAVLQYLIDNGADVEDYTNFGQSAEFLAYRYSTNMYHRSNEKIMTIIENAMGED